MRNVVMISTARTVWAQIPCGANFYCVGIRKYFSLIAPRRIAVTKRKLIGLIKLIITHNIEAQSSYPPGVGSNPTRSQFFSI